MRKVVIIGPESTGKSTLCEELADHYATLWCPEYAREYLTEHRMNYDYEDLLTIAKGQLQLEDKYAEMILRQQKTAHSPLTTHHSPLIVDTDMYVMKVWCEFVFGRCHQFILDKIVERKYHLYMLCNIDLPWAYDPLREYPDDGPRKELYHIYRDLLINQPVPWVEISGNYEERFTTAAKAVDELLNKEANTAVSDTTKAEG